MNYQDRESELIRRIQDMYRRKKVQSRKYESGEVAFEELGKVGKVDFFGRGGDRHEICHCTISLPDGRKYAIDIYDDGLVVLDQRMI